VFKITYQKLRTANILFCFVIAIIEGLKMVFDF